MSDIVNNFCFAIRRKKATIAQFKYLYNNVIMLRLEYLHKITSLTEKQCHTIERRAIALIKNKAQLLITANDNIIFNENLLDIRRLWNNYKEYHITSLTQRLNSISILN